jgi:endonuclease/exonuclease/phosphatase family metal-dependent hydrolase
MWGASQRTLRSVAMTGLVVALVGALVALAGPVEAARRPTPKSLTVSAEQNAITVRWHRVRRAPGYRVRWSTHRSMAGSHKIPTTRHRVRIGGLAPATRYFVQVAVAAHKGHGRRLSRWSRLVARRTPPPPCPTTGDLGDPTPAVPTGRPTDLRVASFNIRTMALDPADHPEQRWRSRRDRVAALLLGAATTRNAASAPPQVIAVQEANESYRAYATRCTNQLIDLRNGLNVAGGVRYEATSLSPSASIGTRILFDTTRLRLERAGAVLLAPAGTTHPHLAWAVFQVRDGGQRFFFGSVHLVPNETASSHTLRDAEWDRLIALLSDPGLTEGLPIVLGGDFNSPHRGAGANTSALTHLPRMYDAGFGDMLIGGLDPGDRELTTSETRPVQQPANAQCASMNFFTAAQRCDEDSSRIGQQIDYLFASNDLVVKDWQLVLDLDAQDNWLGTIPSDHNMLRAVVTLPGSRSGPLS